MVTYNLDIPDGPNNPSNDQPKMKTNTNSIQTLISVDHVGFNTNGSPPNGVGGHHLQVSFDGKNVPGAQTDPQSVLYTNNGSASTISELYYRNQHGISAISAIKAFGSFTGGGTALNSFNITSVAQVGVDPNITYTVTIPANILTGTDYGVLLTAGINSVSSFQCGVYQVVSATQFTIAFRNTTGAHSPDFMTIVVYQI